MKSKPGGRVVTCAAGRECNLSEDAFVKERYEVTVESGFVRVIDPDPTTPNSMRRLCADAPRMAREHGVSKVLIDQRGKPGSLSTMERFRYAADVAKSYQGLRVACVQVAPYRDPDDFGETVALNRGANLRICGTLEEAYEWLRAEPDHALGYGPREP